MGLLDVLMDDSLATHGPILRTMTHGSMGGPWASTMNHERPMGQHCKPMGDPCMGCGILSYHSLLELIDATNVNAD